MNKKYIYIPIFIIFFISCKKKDTVYPDIKITKPVENTQYSAIDSIFIEAQISDDKQIASYSLSIVDNSMKTIGETYSFDGKNEKNIKLNEDFFFSNLYANTGTYYLKISADDGTNIKNEYKKIILTSIPVQLNSIFVTLDNNSNIDICNIDSGKINYLYTVNNNFQDVDVNSDYGQIFVLSKNGNLSAYDAYTNKLLWNKTNLNNYYSNYFAKLTTFDKITYVGYNFGIIKTFDKNGTILNVYNNNNDNSLPSKIFLFNNMLFSYFFTKNTITGTINYFYDSGSLKNTYSINYNEITNIFSYDNDKIIILGNSYNKALVCTLNVDNNYLDTINNFSTEPIISAVKVDNDIYYTTATSVKRYNLTDNANYSFIDNLQNPKVFFEKLNSLFYITNNNEIIIYNKNKQIVTSYTSNKPILDIDFLYNKYF